ncbi:MAG: CxxxxCH/CxxCH domain-containing protein [Desulfuromonadaceae bacterium]|nr:CxxxxCH/CxxCH domain-containing protein [Desulfuromonadaceae bacterium]MDD5104573.1 CxxxxCH/CxxCH domain-containing protein [Desulfuromonadaceae bacterium]
MKKIFNYVIILFVFLSLPPFASATNYWAITAATSPASFKTNLIAARPTNFGNYTTPGGAIKTLTNVTRTPYASVDFDVAAVPGYTVKVKVDGAQKGTTPGTYTVYKGTMLNHNIVATYTAVSEAYIITTIDVADGHITPSVTYSASAAITVTPSVGKQLTGVVIDNVAYPLTGTPALPTYVTMTGDTAGATYTFTSGTHTIYGIFAPKPAAKATLSTPNMTVATGTTGILIDASSSSSNVTDTIYSWTATCGTITPTGLNAKTATYDAPATLGSCIITLTVTAAEVSPDPTASITITTINPVNVRTNLCLSCHNGTGGPDVSSFTSSAHYEKISCQNCHNPDNNLSHAYLPTAIMVNVCITCHSDSPQGHPVEITDTCMTCHNHHTVAASGGCSSCHDSPPNTASHMKHYASNAVGVKYGDLRITQAFTNYSSGYIFGCGNCHPMDIANHNNGVVNIELYNPLATAGSLKAKNPSTAVYVPGSEVFTDERGRPYTKGTCSNVYCHSFNDWTTTAAIGDGEVNWEAKTVTTRIYKDVTWGVTVLGCSGCHGNPTQTSYPANSAGAGDSHSWIDDYGYQSLHTWNMYGEPVSCTYCHNDTVKKFNTYTVDGNGVNVLSEVPISNFSKHVNGSNDVAFDKQNPYIYPVSEGTGSYSLANATYDADTKNCSNVSCHIQQTTVKWGTPYRYNSYNECNVCHQK